MGRGRLSNIELLPEPCAPVVAWAAEELSRRDRTQTDIYKEFVERLEAIDREFRGELDLTIPSFQAFNRYSLRLAALSRRMTDMREIAGSIAGRFDAEGSDDLTLIAAEAIKTLIFELLTTAGDAGIKPTDAMALANALRAATQAQSVSTARRQKVETEFAEKAKAAVQSVAKKRGLSDAGVQEILDQILGVPS